MALNWSSGDQISWAPPCRYPHVGVKVRNTSHACGFHRNAHDDQTLHSWNSKVASLHQKKKNNPGERGRYLYGWLVSSGTNTQILCRDVLQSKDVTCLEHLLHIKWRTLRLSPCRAHLMLQKPCHFSQTRRKEELVVNAANGGAGNLCSYPGSITGFLCDLGQVP